MKSGEPLDKVRESAARNGTLCARALRDRPLEQSPMDPRNLIVIRLPGNLQIG
jgi:hypothetical protein